MLAAGGLLILIAMGFALSGMILDDGTEPSGEPDDALPAGDESNAAAQADLPIMPIDALLFDNDEEALRDATLTADNPTAPAIDPPEIGAETMGDGAEDSTPTLPDSQSPPSGGTINDMLQGREVMAELLSGESHDAQTGGSNDDLITGTDGTDAIFGNEGDDSLHGGEGADEIYGDEGDDSIMGGTGRDFLVGGDGNDTVMGGADGDMIFGSDGDDLLSGDEGDDFLQGGFGADTLLGGQGNDTLDGSFSAGHGGFGPFDQDRGDHLEGGDGDDVILIGAADVATGGEGRDTFITGSFIEMAELAGHVTDFDPSQDVIEVMFDPNSTPDPIITVVDLDDGTGANILFNGEVILTVSGAQGLDPAAIELREVELAPAA